MRAASVSSWRSCAASLHLHERQRLRTRSRRRLPLCEGSALDEVGIGDARNRFPTPHAGR